MRILYFERDIAEARKCHAQLLAYKGIPWELQHCHQVDAARESLAHHAIDLVVLGLNSLDLSASITEELIASASSIPIVGLVDSLETGQIRDWLRVGLSDVIVAQGTSGDWWMRRMRLAVARYHRSMQERHSVQLRQIYAQSHVEQTVGAAVDRTVTEEHVPEPIVPYEQARMIHTLQETDRLSIAILKDRGTPRLLESDLGIDATVEVFRDVESYVDRLRRDPASFDVTVVEQDLYERSGSQSFRHSELRFPGPPLVLLCTDRSDAAAASYTEELFDDCIHQAHLTTSALVRGLLLCRERSVYQVNEATRLIREAPKVSDRRRQARGADRRIAARYLITRPLLAIPVLPDGAPDRAGIRDAFSIDFSAGGIGFQISNHDGLPSRNWVLGVECVDEQGECERFHFCNVLVRNVSYPQGGVRMGGQFQTQEEDLLSLDRLYPKLQVTSGKFECSLSQRAIDQWVELGVFEKKLLHRLQACPECRGTVTLGHGCRECGSPDIHFHKMIHHYACAHVGKASTFGSGEELSCPKCLTRKLVASSDFEVIRSHYSCRDCGFEGSQLENVATCLGCQLRFPSSLAQEVEVYGYDVERLDILAVVNATS